MKMRKKNLIRVMSQSSRTLYAYKVKTTHDIGRLQVTTNTSELCCPPATKMKILYARSKSMSPDAYNNPCSDSQPNDRSIRS